MIRSVNRLGLLLALSAAGLTLLLAARVALGGSSYELSWYTFGPGGASSSTNYGSQSVVGEVSGSSASTNYELDGGFLAGAAADSDGDGCPDVNEQQTAVGSELTGGRRNYLNPYDYFNPTNDGTIRVDDVLAVVGRYYSIGNPAGPLNTIPPAPPAYHAKFNRAPLGPNVWNLTQGSGQVLLADILAVIKQYFHDCGTGIVKVP